jgi:hypothetical protein
MKKPYSEYSYSKMAKLFAGVSGAKRDIFLDECINHFRNKGMSEENIMARLYVLDIEARCLSGHGTHLFVRRDVFDWLGSRAKDVDIPTDWVNDMFGMASSAAAFTKFERAFVLHVQGGGSPAGILCPMSDMKNNRLAVFISHSKDSTTFTPIAQTLFPKMPDSELRVARFLIGLYMYNQACGGVIVDGVPEDLKHEPRYKGRRQTVRIDDEIFDHHNVTPHFRNGHFRLLSSDRFTKKRGQIVFVRDCFVKGKAAHIEENILTPHASMID